MKRVLSKSFLGVAGLLAVCGGAASAPAAILFEEGQDTTLYPGYKSVANGNATFGYGGSYNTGISGNILLAGLTFKGGFANTPAVGDTLSIDFYNSSGGFVTAVTPASSEVFPYGSSHTLAASDFGSGVTLPGSGYFFFVPSNPSGSQVQFNMGFGDNDPHYGGITVGTFPTTSNIIDDSGVITTYSPVTFGEADFPTVTFSGSAVPEPASLSLLASGGLLLLRRRRTA